MSQFRSRGELPPTEADDAKRHWGGLGVSTSFTREADWPGIIARELAALEPDSVLEFGCNVGRNLCALADLRPGARLVGLDVNREAVAWGREQHGLDLRVGDERTLAELPDDEFDAAFTVSVLDHLPDPEPALWHLIRIARRQVLLLEPWLGVEGKVVDERDGRPLQPYSYSWDYPALFARLGAGRVSERPQPLRAGRWGPHYRLYRWEPLVPAECPDLDSNQGPTP
jgi:SAM-dependent methyltransferase